jgi:hypothetical protein
MASKKSSKRLKKAKKLQSTKPLTIHGIPPGPNV